MKAAYDIVLVDSRTGLNEISGLCIGPLCDVLVVCTGLNEQNVEGTRYFMSQAGLFDKDRAKPYLVSVGPVPPWTRAQTDKRLSKVGSALRVEKLAASVPYHPAAALGEPIFVVDEPGEPISLAYRELSSRIVGLSDVFGTRWPGDDAPMSDVARELPRIRLSTRLLEAPRYSASWPTFAAISSMVPERFTSRGLGVHNLHAAVAAYQLRSREPLLRAFSRNGHHEESSVPLVFYRLRLADRIPIDLEGGDAWMAEVVRNASRRSDLWRSDVVAYALALGLDLENAARVEKKKRVALKEDSLRWSRILRHQLPQEVSPELERALEAVQPYVFEADVPHDLKEEAKYGFDHTNKALKAAKKYSRSRPPFVEFGYGYDERMPLGGPFPLMASLVALMKGRTATDEIVGWLDVCRQQYGYAWRVLVDWRHLAEIRDEPAFIAFLKEEDDAVAAIEHAIDTGEYLSRGRATELPVCGSRKTHSPRWS